MNNDPLDNSALCVGLYAVLSGGGWCLLCFLIVSLMVIHWCPAVLESVFVLCGSLVFPWLVINSSVIQHGYCHHTHTQKNPSILDTHTVLRTQSLSPYFLIISVCFGVTVYLYPACFIHSNMIIPVCFTVVFSTYGCVLLVNEICLLDWDSERHLNPIN